MRESQNTLKRDITFTLVYNTVNTFFGIKTQTLEFKVSPLQDYIHKTPIIISAIVD
jgi:hypothetical protein